MKQNWWLGGFLSFGDAPEVEDLQYGLNKWLFGEMKNYREELYQKRNWRDNSDKPMIMGKITW